MNSKKDQTKETLLPSNKKKDPNADTDTDGMDPIDDPKAVARRAGRPGRQQYRAFLRENKAFWMWFNMTVVLASIGLGIGTYFVLNSNEADCGFIQPVLWLVIMLHFVNLIVCLFNLCGIEKKLCN